MPRKWNQRAKVMQALRKLSLQDPARYEALVRARCGRNLYRCAKCRGKFARKQVQADHIHPVIRLTGFDGNWTEVIARLFPGVDGYQVLCVPCHADKTLHENYKRRSCPNE